MKITSEIKKYAETLYEFQRIDMKIEKSDLILVPCSHDLRVADYASELFLSGYGSKIIFSGGIAHEDDLLSTGWGKAEAEIFANRAIELGVPINDIILEKQAKNTGENITYSMELIQEMDIPSDRILLVQKPYMQQRAFLTFRKQYSLPYSSVMVTGPQIIFDDYVNIEINMEDLINILVGDLERLIIYPKMGYQDKIDIPSHVMHAFEKLKEKGFTEHITIK